MTFRKGFRVAAFCLLQVWSAVALAEERRPTGACHDSEDCISLAVGEQQVISAEGVQSYSEGLRGIVDVRLTKDGRTFVLVGQTRGTTNLLLLMNDGRQRQLRVVVEAGDEEEKKEGIERRANIRLDFYFVELNRSSGRQMGLKPANSIGPKIGAEFDFLTQEFQSATAVIEDQVLVRLDLAQSSGFAKLSRKAAVISENGEKSQLTGGGEVNIPVQGSLTTGIHKISFGSDISVEPRFDPVTRRLEIRLVAEVSDLIDDRGTGAPGRTTASIATTVNLELGEAIVLAGLSATSETKVRSGIPLLSQLPIFGYFFGSEHFTKQITDQVVFIVPSVIDSVPGETRRELDAAFEAYRDFSGGSEPMEQVRKSWGMQ